MSRADDELARLLTPLKETLEAGDTGALEEVFTRTFDNNAERALEIGWQLHGENYDRGRFMVQMRQALREHGIEEGTELPDHLSAALKLLPRLETERAWRFAGSAVLPAIEKVLKGFRGLKSPYEGVVQAAAHMIKKQLKA